MGIDKRSTILNIEKSTEHETYLFRISQLNKCIEVTQKGLDDELDTLEREMKYFYDLIENKDFLSKFGKIISIEEYRKIELDISWVSQEIYHREDVIKSIQKVLSDYRSQLLNTQNNLQNFLNSNKKGKLILFRNKK